MGYTTLQDVRDAGLSQADYPDDDVNAAIDLWSAFIDRATGQWFEERAATFYLDGTDSDLIALPVPIISINEIRINDDSAALDTSLYRVYNGRGPMPDDRKHPRIQLVDLSNRSRDIYLAPDRTKRLMFRKGRQNIYVDGSFGYLEADDSTPPLIERACLKLVIEKLTNPVYDTAPTPPPPLVSGIVLEEWTDGHRLKYAQAGGAYNSRAPGLSGITSDPEILDILKLYRAPLGVAVVSADTSYR